MLRYRPEQLRRMTYSQNALNFKPFSGRYPTRLYAWDPETRWHYFGKPTRAAWAAILRHERTMYGWPFFTEFDRKYIVRRSDEAHGYLVSPAIVHYYMADHHQMRELRPEEFALFEAVRLREGSLYCPVDWQERYHWTNEQRLRYMRGRLRGVIRAIQDNAPVPPTARPEDLITRLQRRERELRAIPRRHEAPAMDTPVDRAFQELVRRRQEAEIPRAQPVQEMQFYRYEPPQPQLEPVPTVPPWRVVDDDVQGAIETI